MPKDGRRKEKRKMDRTDIFDKREMKKGEIDKRGEKKKKREVE